jgi:protein-L-isoaspartate(D-aspartate) O-methyltransferase
MSNRESAGIGMTSERTRGRMVDRLRSEGIVDEAVLAIMESIPRHLFVDEALSTRAYEDSPLPIGFGQTISSPYIVARMTELIHAPARIGKVLEIGTGSGYHTAVLARLWREVYTVERIAQLIAKARGNFRRLRLRNIRLTHGDGARGLPEAAPFDAILVTAAVPRVPPELLQQLASGGRMVLPLGGADQRLYLIENTPGGTVETGLEAVKFVPLRANLE